VACGLVPIPDDPEGVGATEAPACPAPEAEAAEAVVGITLFLPLGVDTTMGWDGDGCCVEAIGTGSWMAPKATLNWAGLK